MCKILLITAVTLVVLFLLVCFFLYCIGKRTDYLRKNLKVNDKVHFYLDNDKVSGVVTKINGDKIQVKHFVNHFIINRDNIHF